jgi:hypothetical protein
LLSSTLLCIGGHWSHSCILKTGLPQALQKSSVKSTLRSLCNPAIGKKKCQLHKSCGAASSIIKVPPSTTTPTNQMGNFSIHIACNRWFQAFLQKILSCQ